MARQTRKQQEQLSFPELAFLAPMPTVDPDQASKMDDTPAPATESPSQRPRRAARPRMVVVRDGNAERHAAAVVPGAVSVGPAGAPDRPVPVVADIDPPALPQGVELLPRLPSVPTDALPVEAWAEGRAEGGAEGGAKTVVVRLGETPSESLTETRSEAPAHQESAENPDATPAATPDALATIPAGLSDIVGHVSLHLGEATQAVPASRHHAGPVAGAPSLPCEPVSMPIVSPEPLRQRPAANEAAATSRPDAGASSPNASPTASPRVWLRGSAQAASLLAALVTVGVLSIGLIQFIDTQRVQRDLASAQQAALTETRNGQMLDIQTRAVDLLLRYNELTQQASLLSPRTARKERLQRELLALGLLDTLHAQTRGLALWDATIAGALEKHLRFIREQRLVCADYTPAFLALIERVAGLKAIQLCRD